MKGEGVKWLGQPTAVTPTSKGQRHLLPLSSFPTTVNSYFLGLQFVILLTHQSCTKFEYFSINEKRNEM